MAKTKRKKYKRKAGSLTVTGPSSTKERKAATKLQSHSRAKATRKHTNRLRLYRNLPPELQDEVNKKYNKIDVLKRQSNALLIRGATEGNLNMVKFALERYGDVNTDGRRGETPLYIASNHGHLEVVKFLLDSGANVDARENGNGRYTPLHIALEMYEDVNTGWEEWYVPQLIAKNDRYLEIVKLLIEKGANIEAPKIEEKEDSDDDDEEDSDDDDEEDYYFGDRPLHVAIFEGNLEAVELLLKKGANVDAIGMSRKYTPLQTEVKWAENLEVTKLLLQYGANTEVRDKYGDTPLHEASKEGRLEFVKLLLNAGADVNIENYSGNTPLKIAKNRGHREIVKLLEEKIEKAQGKKKKRKKSRNH